MTFECLEQPWLNYEHLQFQFEAMRAALYRSRLQLLSQNPNQNPNRNLCPRNRIFIYIPHHITPQHNNNTLSGCHLWGTAGVNGAILTGPPNLAVTETPHTLTVCRAVVGARVSRTRQTAPPLLTHTLPAHTPVHMGYGLRCEIEKERGGEREGWLGWDLVKIPGVFGVVRHALLFA